MTCQERGELSGMRLVSNPGISHPDGSGKGHRARPRPLCPALTCEWSGGDEGGLHQGEHQSPTRLCQLFTPSPFTPPAPLEGQEFMTALVTGRRHHSSQNQANNRTLPQQNSVKRCFHHTASRGYGHKAKEKGISDIHWQNIEENCSKTCLLALRVIAFSNLANCLWII